MSKFVLTAQLNLQAPRNTKQVINQMRGELSGLSVPVDVKGAAKAKKQIDSITQSTDKASNAATRMGKSFGVALKRFAAFTLATRAVSLFTNTLSNAVDEAIQFQREMIKISQVTGKSLKQLRGLNEEITRLSVNLGTSASELLGATRILAQAGIAAGDLKIALQALAKTTLAPTFEDINKTAEGAVAILAQFGKGVGALERQLGAINAVAGQFAVESGDLIGAIRRTGGVFKAAGGSLEEFLGLFTSIRATTRESSESIATGLRTILTRIQRPKTLQYLKELGVSLTDLNGRFVGPYEAVRRLSKALGDLPAGDVKFVQIAEELGGFRQIGKVIPLLQQFETAEKARQAALKGAGSLDKDAATAQQALATQINKVRQEFGALIRGITETPTFQVMAKTVLNLASAFLKVADAIKPLIPLIGAFAAFKAAKGLTNFVGGVGSALSGVKKAKGGMIGMNRGGVVPGTGNRDTVPAMLTPGEFVIRKSSVEKIGADRLHGMNKYANGGKAKKKRGRKRILGDVDIPGLSIGQVAPKGTPKTAIPKNVFATHQQLGFNVKAGEEGGKFRIVEPVQNLVLSGEGGKTIGFEGIVKPILTSAQKKIDKAAANAFGGRKTKTSLLSDKNAVDTIGGFVFESFGSAVLGQATGDKAAFDYMGKQRSKMLEAFTESDPAADLIDAKKTHVTRRKIVEKALLLKKQNKNAIRFKRKALGGFARFAMGGIVNANKVGAAILDPDAGVKPEDVNVGLADVRSYIKGSGADPSIARKDLNKVYSGKKYKIYRQGLNKETSDRFRSALLSGAAKGLSDATAGLSSDLGLGSAALTKDGQAQMEKYLGSRVVGQLYEAGVGILSSQGAFKDTPVSQPFDYPNGLGGKLRDNFNQLPGSWVDAKSSYAAAKDMKGKIANEIADEYKRSGEYNKAIANHKKKLQKKASGGGISGKDTVPALLTPGEFVINKESAQRIGHANLNRMNKKGVVGFNAGGPVGPKKMFLGGGVGGGDKISAVLIALSTLAATANSFSDSSSKASAESAKFADATKALTGAFTKLLVYFQLAKGLQSFIAGSEEGADSSEKQADSADRASESLDNLSSSADSFASGGGAGGIAKDTMSGPVEHVGGVAAGSMIKLQKELGTYVEPKKEAEAEAPFEFKKKVSKEDVTERLRNREQEKQKQRDDLRTKKKTLEQDIQQNVGKIDQEALAKQNQMRGYRLQAEQNMAGSKQAFEAHQDTRQKQQREIEFRAGNIDAIRKSSGLQEIEKDTVYEQSRRAREELSTVETERAESERLSGKADNYLQGRSKQSQKDAARLEELQRVTNQGTNEEGFGAGLGIGGTAQEREERDKLLKKRSKIEEIAATEQKKQTSLTERETKAKDVLEQAKAGTLDSSDNTPELAEARKQWAETNQTAIEGIETERAAQQQNIQMRDAAEKGMQSEATKYKQNAAIRQKAGTEENKQYNKQKDVLDENIKLREEHAKVTKQEGEATKQATSATKKRRASEKRGIKATLKGIFTRDKDTKSKKKAEKQTKKSSKADKGRVRSEAQVEAAVKKSGRNLEQWKRETDILSEYLDDATDATEAHAKAILEKTEAEQKAAKGGGMFGKVRKGAGRIASGVGMGVGLFESLVSGVTSFFGDQAQRRADKARATGDVGRTAAATEEAAQMRALGEAFSLSGLVMGAFGLGPTLGERMQQAKEEGAVAGVDVGVSETDKIISSAVSDGMLTPAQAIQKSNQKMGAALTGLKASGMSMEEQKMQAARFKESAVSLATFTGSTVKSSAELEKALSSIVAPSKEIREALEKAGRAAFKVAEAQRALARANFDNLKVMSAFNAANSSVNSFLSSLDTGSIELTRHIATFENSLSNIGMSEEGKKALQAAQDQVLSAVGGEDTSLGQAAKRTFGRAATAQQFMGSIQDRIGGLDISATNDNKAREELTAALTKGVQDADMRSAIEGAVAGMDKVVGKDLSQIAMEVQEALGPMAKGALDSAKALAQHQMTIVKLTQKRRQAELAYIAAQQRAIDAQLQLADQFEAFGGEKLGQDEKTRATLTKANLTLRDAGVSGLTSGSAKDFARSRKEILTRLQGQQITRGAGGFAGAQGVENERIKELNNSLNAIASAMAERASQIKTEIALIQKKNEAEKNSIEALLSGDINKFFEQQQAAGAAMALRSGDAALAGLFSASALGEGFKSLQGQGLSSREMERAAGITTRAVGMTSPRSAQVLAGTADGVGDLMKEGQELTKEQMRTANAMAEAAKMEVKANEVTIQTAKLKFEETMQQKGAQQDAADRAVGKARGGLIYASRGIFVPRGTDTVPAMLTPGEFVVNRNAVKRGNNLQILRAMNSSNGQTPAAPAAAAMSRGGQVGYYALGDIVQNVGNVFSEALPSLAGSIGAFTSAVDKLTGFKFEVGVTQVPPITVNLAGGNVLNQINESISQSIITEVAKEIGKYKVNQTGSLQKSEGINPR